MAIYLFAYATGVLLLIFSGFYGYWSDLSIYSAIPAGAAALFVGIGVVGTRKRDDFSDIAGWRIEEAAEISEPEKPVVAPAVLDIKSLDLGMLVVGGPGAGKSMMAIAYQEFLSQYRPDSGMAYFEGKGDFDIYRDRVAAVGHPDYFFSSELEHSDTINVMASPTETIIDTFSRVFVDSTNGYYEASQKKAIRATVPLIKSLGEPVILPDLWMLLTDSQAARDVIRKAKDVGVDPDIVATCEQYFQEDEEDRLNKIDGLLNKLHPFVSGPISRKINAYEPTLNISDAVAAGKTVYFHLPLSDTSLAVATMITEQFGVVARNRQLYELEGRKAYPLMFDDWGAFFYSNFGPITARCRSAKMPINFFFQSKAQTDAVLTGGIFTSEILDNIGGVWSMRINGWDTAKWLAQQFGTYETQEISFRAGSDDQQMMTVEKERVRTDWLRDLNAGEAYGMIFATAEGGLMVNKRYQLRFPLPGKHYDAPTYWPEVAVGVSNDDAFGLHLWRDYRDADQVALRKREAVKSVLDGAGSDLADGDDEVLL